MINQAQIHYELLVWLFTREQSFTTTTEVAAQFLTTRTVAQKWLDAMVAAGLQTRHRKTPEAYIRKGSGREWYYYRNYLLVKRLEFEDQVQDTDLSKSTVQHSPKLNYTGK